MKKIGFTTIQVPIELRKELEALRLANREPFADVITRLIEKAKQTKLEVAQA